MERLTIRELKHWLSVELKAQPLITARHLAAQSRPTAIEQLAMMRKAHYEACGPYHRISDCKQPNAWRRRLGS